MYRWPFFNDRPVPSANTSGHLTSSTNHKLRRVNELLHRNRHLSLHRKTTQQLMRKKDIQSLSLMQGLTVYPSNQHKQLSSLRSLDSYLPPSFSFQDINTACCMDMQFQKLLNELPSDFCSDNPFFSGIDAMPDIRPRKKSIPLVSELVLKVSFH